MDPDACLARLIDAAVAGARVRMMFAADDLNYCLRQNKYPPKDPRVTEETKRAIQSTFDKWENNLLENYDTHRKNRREASAARSHGQLEMLHAVRELLNEHDINV